MSQLKYEYFLAIVEAQSISKAADKLMLSQPYLSQYLNRLERELGVTLFDRGRIPIKLTTAGELYLEYIRDAMQLRDNLSRTLRDISESNRGQLTIGFPSIRGGYLLPQVVPLFKQRYPNIEIVLREGPTAKLRTLVQRKEVDFAFDNQFQYSEEFIYEPLIEERILFVAPKADPETDALPFDSRFPTSIGLDFLRDKPLVLLNQGSNLTNLVNNLYNRIHAVPRISIQTDITNTATALVAAGMGYSFESEMGIHYSPNARNVRFYTIDSPPLSWQLAIVYHKEIRPSPVTRYMVDLLKAACQKFRRDTDTHGLLRDEI